MEASVSPKMRTVDMAYIAIFAVLIAICSWISIPAAVGLGVLVLVDVVGLEVPFALPE